MRKIIIVAVLLVCTGVETSCARGTQADSSQQIADRIVESKVPVVLDFWASWCMPCRILDPMIEELEKEYKGKVKFIKVDVDVHREVTSYFRVSAVPSVFIIEDKTVRTMIPGVGSKKHYKDAIDSALKLAADRKKAAPKEDKQVCSVNCD